MHKCPFFVLVLLLLALPTVRGAIPVPGEYESGTIRVPEDYSLPGAGQIELYWECHRATSPRARALVCINGGPGMPHDSFHRPDPQKPGSWLPDPLSALRSEFDLYYFDQRGVGRSSPLTSANLATVVKSRFGTDTILRDLEELRNRVIRQPTVCLFGESYGGMVALSYALAYPDRVEKLVLHDTAPSNEYYVNLAGNFTAGLATLEKSRYPGLQVLFTRALERLDAGEIQLPSGFTALPARDFLVVTMALTYSVQGQHALAVMVKQLANEGKSAILDAVLKDFKRKPPAEPWVTTYLVQATEMQDELKIAMQAQLPVATGSIYSAAFMDRMLYEPRRAFRSRHGISWFFPYDLLGELPRLTHPTLILVGRYDFVTPEPFARQMAYGIGPQATVVVLENSAHAGFFEENARVTELVGHFLGRQARPGELPSNEAFPLSMLQSETRPARRRPPSPREAVDACRLGLRYLGY